MKSTPNFEVDIVRGGKTLSFTCSFMKGAPEEGEYSKCGYKNHTTFHLNKKSLPSCVIFTLLKQGEELFFSESEVTNVVL